MKRLRTHLLIFAALSLYLAVTWQLQTGCISQMLFHLPCPGCGLTRAWVAALHLDFAAALSYHPLFWLAPPLILTAQHQSLLRRRGIPKGCFTAMYILCGIAFLIVYLFRFFN